MSRYPDIEVVIYEAAPKFAEVGAGIGVWPRVWKILSQLGLDEDLAKVTALMKPTFDTGGQNFLLANATSSHSQPSGHILFPQKRPTTRCRLLQASNRGYVNHTV